jgi:hypothetical protein
VRSLAFILSLIVSMDALTGCGDDDSQCPSGQRYSQKVHACYKPECPGKWIFDELRETCRAPCPPGFAFESRRRICYPCPDAAVGEWGEESVCDEPDASDWQSDG